MSAKNRDNNNRFRSKTVGFRVSPEEWEQFQIAVKLSGLTKLIKVIDESDKALPMLDERIEQAIIKENAKVIILDPIQAYVGKDTNMNCANEIREVMKNIAIVAASNENAVCNSRRQKRV